MTQQVLASETGDEDMYSDLAEKKRTDEMHANSVRDGIRPG